MCYRVEQQVNKYLIHLLKDSSGQEFTVVLLDSEGLDAVTDYGSDDLGIFIVTILLSSMLIYNSSGVPTRNDLERLEYPRIMSTLEWSPSFALI